MSGYILADFAMKMVSEICRDDDSALGI